MKVFVTGVGGQLGHEVMEELKGRGIEAIGSDIGPDWDVSLDITNREAVDAVLTQIQPDAVIHCAAWTAVDAAEEAENQEKVRAINAQGTRYIAESCKALGCKLLYISTDYVFDGQGETPWDPDFQAYAPLNVYGQTKLEGEQAVVALVEKHFIVRISWVFGRNGGNFVKTMLRVGQSHDAVRVVNDQIGTPTYTRDLARLLAEMVATEKYGVYHAANSGGYISWYDFCCEIYRQAGMNTQVIPVSSQAYGMARAARPYNSRLNLQKLVTSGFETLPPWKDALRRFLQELDEKA